MVDSSNEKTPRGVSGSVSGSSGLQVFEHYQEKGRYRICWTGPASDLVYSAWYRATAKHWKLLGCFKQGAIDEREAAAEQCCREHWQTRRGDA